MTPEEHRQEAVRLLAMANDKRFRPTRSETRHLALIAEAQVHATLALGGQYA